MVVPVLMISCQVSEKPKWGPVIAQTAITPTAKMNVLARPAPRDALLARVPNQLESPRVFGGRLCRLPILNHNFSRNRVPLAGGRKRGFQFSRIQFTAILMSPIMLPPLPLYENLVAACRSSPLRITRCLCQSLLTRLMDSRKNWQGKATVPPPPRAEHRVQFENGFPAHLMAIDGTWRRECLLQEVSDENAVLSVISSIEGLHLKEFFLLLSSTGLAYRRCALEWVNGDQIGVTFLAQKGKRKSDPVPARDREQTVN